MPVEASVEWLRYAKDVNQPDLLPAVRYDIAPLCEILSEPTRLAMVLALMDGSARPAGEFARQASISAQTASSHFGKLVAGGVFAVERQGRHRYYRIANDELAHAIEALGVARPLRRARAPSASIRRPLEFARTCYRHLAGTLGVQLRERLELDGLVWRVGDRYELSAAGVKQLASFLDGAGRPLTGKPCLDWTERRFHIGGPLGIAITQACLSKGWLRRATDSRALQVTLAGERGFRSLFGLEIVAGSSVVRSTYGEPLQAAPSPRAAKAPGAKHEPTEHRH